MDVSQILSFLKLPRKIYFLSSIITAILLFSNESFLETLSIKEFKDNYAFWIGITFLASIGMSVMYSLEYLISIYKLIEKYWLKKKARDAIYKILADLDMSELAVIREFYNKQKNTLYLSYDDPSVLGLIDKGIVVIIDQRILSTHIIGISMVCCSLNRTAKEYFVKYDFSIISSISIPTWSDVIPK